MGAQRDSASEAANTIFKAVDATKQLMLEGKAPSALSDEEFGRRLVEVVATLEACRPDASLYLDGLVDQALIATLSWLNRAQHSNGNHQRWTVEGREDGPVEKAWQNARIEAPQAVVVECDRALGLLRNRQRRAEQATSRRRSLRRAIGEVEVADARHVLLSGRMRDHPAASRLVSELSRWLGELALGMDPVALYSGLPVDSFPPYLPGSEDYLTALILLRSLGWKRGVAVTLGFARALHRSTGLKGTESIRLAGMKSEDWDAYAADGEARLREQGVRFAKVGDEALEHVHALGGLLTAVSLGRLPDPLAPYVGEPSDRRKHPAISRILPKPRKPGASKAKWPDDGIDQVPPSAHTSEARRNTNEEQGQVRRAICLTALPVEFQAVRSKLSNVREQTHAMGTIYEVGDFAGSTGRWEIAVVEVGPGNSGAALEVERAVGHFRPEIALLVGVAGGIKDVSVGDVVVATKVYGYESGKDGVSGFAPRPDVGECSYALVQRARAVARAPNLIKAKIVVAPIAAGQKVVAATQSATAKLLQSQYSDAVAVEMEGRGFLEAAHANRTIEALVVRGVSDLLDGKKEADARGSQEVASTNAATVAFEVLSRHTAPGGRGRERGRGEPFDSLNPGASDPGRNRAGSDPASPGHVVETAAAPGTGPTAEAGPLGKGTEATTEETVGQRQQDMLLWTSELSKFVYNRSEGFWESKIEPLATLKARPNHDQLRELIRGAAVAKRGWVFPQTSTSGTFANRANGCVTLSYDVGANQEVGAFFNSGRVCYARRLWEDCGLLPPTEYGVRSGSPGLEFVQAIYSVAELTLFAGRYLKALGSTGDVGIRIHLAPARERQLFSIDRGRVFNRVFRCVDDNVDIDTVTTTSSLVTSWKDVAADLIAQLFSLFNWTEPGPDRNHLIVPELERFEGMN